MQTKPRMRDTVPELRLDEPEMGDTAAARFDPDAVPVSIRQPRSTPPRVLLACSDESIGGVVAQLQDGIGQATIDQVSDGARLDAQLRTAGPYALVISQANLPGMRGLDVLTKARDRGDSTPFVLIQSVHQNFVRITMSGGLNAVVSTRVVNTVALVDLVQQTLAASVRLQ